jgi:hypothetical protein
MRLDVTDASTTTDDATIRGTATGGARTYGVFGITTSVTTNASGVRGEANGAAVVNGVWGSSSSANGTGVYGLGTSATGTGVYGLANSGVGVYGEVYGANGLGVLGIAEVTNGFGVTGLTNNAGGLGVYADNSNANGDALVAINSAPEGTGSGAAIVGLTSQGGGALPGVGIWGVNLKVAGNQGTGVAGYIGNGPDYFTIANAGVTGLAQSTIAGGRGVIGACDNATGVGVQGQTAGSGGVGIQGLSSGAGASVGVLGSNTGANIQAVGVYGTASNAIAGTSFRTLNLRKSIYGQANGAAGSYRFGICGNGGFAIRTGGVIGLNEDVNTLYSSGALGYYSAAGANVAVYGFGVLYTQGAAGGQIIYDKNENSLFASHQSYVPFESSEFGLNNDDVNFDKWSDKSPNTTVGLGIYGGVMGGWIKGLVYGTNLSGVKYGLYVHGKTITNNFIATLHNTGQDERIATYAPTAMKVDVIERGKGKLQNGKVVIRFSEEFTKLISENEDLTITVTPLGSSKGLYIKEYSALGFVVQENEGGNSTLDFNWIAVGVRNGFEKPSISEEIKQRDFEIKMNGDYGVMFNDNNPQNPLYSVWFDGTKVRFDKPSFNKTIQPDFREHPKSQELPLTDSPKSITKENPRVKTKNYSKSSLLD